MEKSIQFKGISLDRSDQLAQDGELSYCNGAEIKDGTIRPAVVNKTALGALPGELLYVHTANGYTHYIFRKVDVVTKNVETTTGDTTVITQVSQNVYSLAFYVEDDSGSLVAPDTSAVPTGEISTLETLTSSAFSSMGNTLIVNSPGQGLYYIVWRPETSTYRYLGAKPPMINIAFQPGGSLTSPNYEINNTSNIKYTEGLDKTPLDKSVLPYGFYILDWPDFVGGAFKYFCWKKSDIYEEPSDVGPMQATVMYNKMYIRKSYQAAFTEAVWALINRVNSNIAENGRFYAPFFVRYAYRMYDGSLFMHSAPVLIAADLAEMPQINVNNVSTLDDKYYIGKDSPTRSIVEKSTSDSYNVSLDDDHEKDLLLSYKPIDFKLQHSISSIPSDLADWSDVIQSVDIFISAPLVWYDDTKLIDTLKYDGFSYPQYINAKGSKTEFIYFTDHDYKAYEQQPRPTYDEDGKIVYDEYGNIVYATDEEGHYIYDEVVVTKTITADVDKELRGLHAEIPRTYPDEDRTRRFMQTSSFFLLKSINISDLETTSDFEDLDVRSSVVENITTQELMKDEYHGHINYVPSGQFLYNHRLHIFGNYQTLFEGFPLSSLLENYTSIYGDDNTIVTNIAVKLSTDIGDLWVKRDFINYRVLTSLLRGVPMYYPDARATMMQLTTSVSTYITFKMEEHPELNGAMTVPSSYAVSSTPTYAATSSENKLIPVSDSLLISDADNPFTFPAENVCSIGNGKVLGLCTATRALSQGQFGAFPLMAFCTDGIWALETASSGIYSAVNPISREVCAYTTQTFADKGITNHIAKTILQLDQSIIFATDRGLCQLIGSEVIPVSECLKGMPLSESSLLSLIPESILSKLQTKFPLLKLDYYPSADFPIIGGSMEMKPLYDYVNHRLLLFSSDYSSGSGVGSPALVYTESDKQFTMLYTDSVLTALNSYPYPYLQTSSDKTVYRLDKQTDFSDNTLRYCTLVTRHFSLGGLRDAVSAIRHERDFPTAPLLILFGSNDAVTDHYIGCFNRDHAEYLACAPFRYFRILMVLSMTQWQRYSALILGITSKHSKL